SLPRLLALITDLLARKEPLQDVGPLRLRALVIHEPSAFELLPALDARHRRGEKQRIRHRPLVGDDAPAVLDAQRVALDDLGLLAVRRGGVDLLDEMRRLDDQRIAFPPPDGEAVALRKDLIEVEPMIAEVDPADFLVG